MPPSKYLLFLPEKRYATAYLELLRRLLDPEGMALPHITLRHSSRPLRTSALDLYREIHVSDFSLDQVTSFDSSRTGQGVSTVVLLCDSEELEHVSYRPDYPQSIFHVTLYDGPESMLAETALDLLNRHEWNLTFEMDLESHSGSRAALDKSTLALRSGGYFTDLAHKVYLATSAELGIDSPISQLTVQQRLRMLEHIATALHNSSDVVTRPGNAGSTHTRANLQIASPSEDREFLRLGEVAELGQLAFWSEEDISSLSPTGSQRRSRSLQQHSTYITPPELSLDVVDETLKLLAPDELVDFGDPAIGSGIFYAALRHRIGDDRINSARGVEIDAGSAGRTLHRWRRTRLSVLIGDFLNVSPERGTWTLLLANPPYRRSQLIGNALDGIRERLRDELGITLSRRSDLYVYFVLRAHAWMNSNALAAWVIPAEFQVTDYGRSLRDYLTSKVQLVRVHTYDPSDSQFDNALVSTSVIMFRNRPGASSDVVTFSQGGSLKEPAEIRTETAESLRVRPRWSFSFLAEHASVSGTDRHIGDFFEIKRGIATGANSLFVLETETVEALGARHWVKPILPRARSVPGTTVGADVDGNPIPASNLWLIDTAESIPAIASKSPLFARYLESILDAAQDSFLARRRDPVYSQEQRPSPPIAFVYMAKLGMEPRRRFVLNESRAVVLNNYLGMYLKPFLREVVDSDPLLLPTVHRLVSSISTESLTAQGRIYGSGLLKLEPKELARVVLPSHSVWQTLDPR